VVKNGQESLLGSGHHKLGGGGENLYSSSLILQGVGGPEWCLAVREKEATEDFGARTGNRKEKLKDSRRAQPHQRGIVMGVGAEQDLLR